jgi:hypothetical protein
MTKQEKRKKKHDERIEGTRDNYYESLSFSFHLFFGGIFRVFSPVLFSRSLLSSIFKKESRKKEVESRG